MQLVRVSNLMQSSSHICTYQKENRESRCSHFNQSWGALSHYRRHLLLALTPLVIHPLYKEFIWCNYVVPSMGKNNAFYWGKMVPYLLLLRSLTMFGQDSELKLWCDFLFVVEGFFYIYILHLLSVLCCFLQQTRVMSRLAKNTAKNAQTCHSEALLFPPLWFSWPIQSTLGGDSLRFCPVLCLWPVLCTVVLPSYHNVPLIP